MTLTDSPKMVMSDVDDDVKANLIIPISEIILYLPPVFEISFINPRTDRNEVTVFLLVDIS